MLQLILLSLKLLLHVHQTQPNSISNTTYQYMSIWQYVHNHIFETKMLRNDCWICLWMTKICKGSDFFNDQQILLIKMDFWQNKQKSDTEDICGKEDGQIHRKSDKRMAVAHKVLKTTAWKGLLNCVDEDLKTISRWNDSDMKM